jgi:hypothetical protein
MRRESEYLQRLLAGRGCPDGFGLRLIPRVLDLHRNVLARKEMPVASNGRDRRSEAFCELDRSAGQYEEARFRREAGAIHSRLRQEGMISPVSPGRMLRTRVLAPSAMAGALDRVRTAWVTNAGLFFLIRAERTR